MRDISGDVSGRSWGGVLLGGWLLAATPALAGVPFANPPTIVSASGQLNATFTIAPAEVDIGGTPVTTTVYNGLYMPPVLRVNPGDTINLNLIDASTDPTNIHYHGLAVSPLGNGDNVFLQINPGDPPFLSQIPIPANHPQGLFWYHPHFHPGVNKAIAGGLSGGLIVGNVLAPFPELAGITERVLLLKDMKLRQGQPVIDPDPSGKTVRTVNGLFKPDITIAPGELQLWRIGNIGANIYYNLKMGGVPFHIIAQDGNLKNQLVTVKQLLIPPGARFEVLVRGPKQPGKKQLKTLGFSTGPQGDQYPAQVLGRLVVTGARVPEIPLPTTFPPVPDLRQQALTGTRTVVFADGEGEDFLIDGQTFDHDRVDASVPLGALEEWVIQNTSKELHVFHIHQLDFQVISVNGVDVPFTGHQDIVTLPVAKNKKKPGEVRVVIPFTNPLIVGKFVYHCHIVQHADGGMMATIEVTPPAGVAAGAPHH